MSRGAPPDQPEARASAAADLAWTAAVAARGGAFAAAWLAGVCLLAAVVLALLVKVFGLAAWLKLGLLTALLAVRADAVARFRDEPFLPGPAVGGTIRWRLVPMLLTLAFVWLAARAGRRAVEARWRGSALPRVVVAAAGASVPAAVLAALAAAALALSFPGVGLRLHVDPGSAAAGAAALAGLGAAAGAWLRLDGSRAAAALRGGIAGYGWALGLATGITLVVAAFEPGATRAYVEGLRGLGPVGGALFGLHVLALPAQSALLLAPSAGSCLHLAGETALADLCPWSIRSMGPAGALLGGTVTLSPWFLAFHAVPPVAGALAGRAAVRAVRPARPAVSGALAGAAFAGLAVAGAWFVAPGVSGDLPLLPTPTMQVDLITMGAACLAWGVVGGAVGGWLEGRSGGAAQPPRRTSV